MSIYIENKLELPAGPKNQIVVLDIAWHDQCSLLAILGCDEQSTSFVWIHDNEKRETHKIDTGISSGMQVLSMAWHPFRHYLAMGHEGGQVIMWNNEDGECFEGTHSHHYEVISSVWSQTGSYLVSFDSSGLLIMWKSDEQGQIQVETIHDFKDPVCQVANRSTVRSREDELDIKSKGGFPGWRPKTSRMKSRTPNNDLSLSADSGKECCFFVGLLSGCIYYINDKGSSQEVLASGSAIKTLLYHNTKDLLLVVTEAAIMGIFQVDSDGELNELNKLKLSGNGEVKVSWLKRDIIFVMTNEPVLRLWDLETSNNFLLEIGGVGPLKDEAFLTADFNKNAGILACCTNRGRVVMWKQKEGTDNVELSASNWTFHNLTSVASSSKGAKWCNSKENIFAVNSAQNVSIYQKQCLNYAYSEEVAVYQTSATEVRIKTFDTKDSFLFDVGLQITGMTVANHHISCWDGINVSTNQIISDDGAKCVHKGTFPCKTDCVLIKDEVLYILDGPNINVTTFQGTTKQVLSFSSSEGHPICAGICADFISVGTSEGWLKVWHIGGREGKLHITPTKISDKAKYFGEIIYAKVNSTGTKVAFTMADSSFYPDSNLYVLDVNSGAIGWIEFPTRYVSAVQWDHRSSEYLCIEVRAASVVVDKDAGGDSNETSVFGNMENAFDLEAINMKNTDPVLYTFFVDQKHKILKHEDFVMDSDFYAMMGLDVPYICVIKSEFQAPSDKKKIEFAKRKNSTFYGYAGEDNLDTKVVDASLLSAQRILIEDLQGAGEGDDVDSVMRYVYSIRIGNLDGALQHTKGLKSSPKVYDNIAKLCLSCGRLDIALVCLAKMQRVPQCDAIRQTMKKEEDEQIHLAMLAIQLGLSEEAEKIYRERKRFDLLFKLYLTTARFEKAIQLCKEEMRINIKTAYHAYAKQLEKDKKIEEAIEYYEKAETYKYEVPRMLVDDPQNLEAYINRKKERELYTWWGQYLESNKELESALQYYELGEDWLSVVRLLCFCDDHEKAIEIVKERKNKAAAYHLARFLEDRGEFKDAVDMYNTADAFGNACRICQEQCWDEKLWSIASDASCQTMLEAANYFERRQDYPKAVHLYNKAGYVSKAIDLAFRNQEFDALKVIVINAAKFSTNKADPVLLQKCAEYFLQNNEIEKALEMLVAAGKHSDAMELCVEHNFPITEEISDKLLPPKEIDSNVRFSLIEKMAECCLTQGSYHLAAKKYTEAGNKIQAMKALLKSGDTHRIIFYANVCRHRDIYLLAANYLQTTDWNSSPKMFKVITDYYEKAQAYDSLISFHESLAEAEIDDNHNYSKALQIYRKAEDIVETHLKSKSSQYEKAIRNITQKAQYIQKFLLIQQNLILDMDSGMHDLRELLEDEKAQVSVRTGDILALIIEFYVKKKLFKEAGEVLKEMKKFVPPNNIHRYLSLETIKSIQGALNDSWMDNETEIPSGLHGFDDVAEDKGKADDVSQRIGEWDSEEEEEDVEEPLAEDDVISEDSNDDSVESSLDEDET